MFGRLILSDALLRTGKLGMFRRKIRGLLFGFEGGICSHGSTCDEVLGCWSDLLREKWHGAFEQFGRVIVPSQTLYGMEEWYSTRLTWKPDWSC